MGVLSVFENKPKKGKKEQISRVIFEVFRGVYYSNQIANPLGGLETAKILNV